MRNTFTAVFMKARMVTWWKGKNAIEEKKEKKKKRKKKKPRYGGNIIF